jgi:hypothetical protein
VKGLDPDMPPQEEDDSPPWEEQATGDVPFEDLSDDDQVAILENLVNTKGFDRKKLKKPFDEISDETRMQWHTFLKSLP